MKTYHPIMVFIMFTILVNIIKTVIICEYSSLNFLFYALKYILKDSEAEMSTESKDLADEN